MKLLGIHWGQFPEEWEIKDGKAKVRMGEHTIEAPKSSVEGVERHDVHLPIISNP